jgi:phytoene dehydrogenase-like protein
VFKIDYALSEGIPWKSTLCRDAATVHVGGTAEEIGQSEAAVNAGAAPEAPFVLVAQQSHMDPSRAPRGGHTGWAYCQVHHGSELDMTDRIERQIERFAPGFRDVIRARHVFSPRTLQAHNPNMIGGDIGGGANTLRQFLLRPVARWNPYATSDPRLFLCSSSTPPGGGVHGMCGYWAAITALRSVFRRGRPLNSSCDGRFSRACDRGRGLGKPCIGMSEPRRFIHGSFVAPTVERHDGQN